MNFMAQEFAEAIYNFDYGQYLLKVEDSFAGNPPADFSRLVIVIFFPVLVQLFAQRMAFYETWSYQRGPVLWKSVRLRRIY